MHFGDNIGVHVGHNLDEIMLFVIEDYVNNVAFFFRTGLCFTLL